MITPLALDRLTDLADRVAATFDNAHKVGDLPADQHRSFKLRALVFKAACQTLLAEDDSRVQTIGAACYALEDASHQLAGLLFEMIAVEETSGRAVHPPIGISTDAFRGWLNALADEAHRCLPWEKRLPLRLAEG